MSGDLPWIETTADLRRLVESVGGGPVAVDLEADSFHHYRDRVCLVQISFSGRAALVDPLSVLDLAPLRPLFQDPSVRKVLHGADYDLRVLHRDFGLEVRGLFDTMVAARLVGERSFGLAILLETRLQVRLDKSHQRADWSLRPLSHEMAAYAAEDVRHLLELAALLERRLVELDRREWAEEEFRRLEAVRWNPVTNDPEAYRRIKGAGELDDRGLAVLRELFLFRDAEARGRDVPPFRVVRDEALVSLARTRPRLPEELARSHLPSRLVRGEKAARLLEAVARGGAVPEGELPATERRDRWQRDRRFEARVKELRRKRDALAREMDIEPSVLAPRSLLEALIRTRDNGEPWEGTPGLRAWQARILRPLL